MATITTTATGQRITDADWNELRQTTIAFHETPALFESVAEIVDHSEDHEDFETTEGVSVSAYSSPLALWEMKTGQFQPAGNGRRGLWSRIKWGVIETACEDEALETRRPEGVYIHPKIDIMSARIDREASADNGATWSPVLAFNVAGTVADTWRNATGDWVLPEYVEIEAQHAMSVTGAETCYVVALFGGVTIRFYTCQRDADLIDDIEFTVQSFWKCVEEKRRPADLGVRDAQVLTRLNSKIMPEKEVIDMRGDVEFLALIEKKDALSKKAGGLKKEIDAIKAELTSRMEGVGSALISDTKQFTWVTVPDKEEPAKIKKGYTFLRARKVSEKAAGPKMAELLAS